MKCRQAIDLLEPYMDGKLDTAPTEQVREHLASCSECSSEWSVRKELGDFMKSGGTVKAPEGFTDQVMAAIQATEPIYPISKSGVAEAFQAVVFRRLGYSMLLAAAVMLLTINLPFTRYDLPDSMLNGKKINITERTQQLTDAFDQFGSGMRSVYTNFSSFMRR